MPNKVCEFEPSMGLHHKQVVIEHEQIVTKHTSSIEKENAKVLPQKRLKNKVKIQPVKPSWTHRQ